MAARACLLTALLAAAAAQRMEAGAFLDLPEGSPCQADSVIGTCVLWNRCLTLIADNFNRKPYPPICSLEGFEPVICCTNCSLVKDIRDIVVDTVMGGLLYKTKQKSWNKCIEYHLEQRYHCYDGFRGGVTLTRFRTKTCEKQYRDNRLLEHGLNTSTQLCYGDEREVKDTCQGDSGGPLQTPGPLVPCQPVVVGVTSFGSQCGFVGAAGLYTHVAHYVPWIDSVVWPE